MFDFYRYLKFAWSFTEDAANKRTAEVALRWTPTGRRKRGRPKTAWRRTVLKELEEMGQDQLMGRTTNQVQRQCMTAALCPSRDEKDKRVISK